MCVGPWDRLQVYIFYFILGLGIGPVLCLGPWDRLDIHQLVSLFWALGQALHRCVLGLGIG